MKPSFTIQNSHWIGPREIAKEVSIQECAVIGQNHGCSLGLRKVFHVNFFPGEQ
jgi:hypothetical protein